MSPTFSGAPGASFCRVLALNVQVDGSCAEARLVDGVLTLTLPKVQESQPKVVYVRPKQ